MKYDPDIAVVLSANPALIELEPPRTPSVESDVFHSRQICNELFRPFAEYYTDQLPNSSLYVTSDMHVAVEGSEITVRYARPAGGAGDTYPVLFWLHGGGWMFGGLDADDSHLRTIAVELNIAVVNVDYRLVPENPFPIPFEDSYITLKWVVEHASELNLDLKKGFIIGGDSAGGNLSAAIALKARDDPFFSEYPLTGQYLREPCVIHRDALPEKYRDEFHSFSEFTNTPVLTTDRTLGFFNTYAAPPSDTRFSPLLAASHHALPPAFIQIQELDPLRDDGKLYENLLRQAGVPTKLIQYSGCFHAFHYCFPAIAAARKLDRDAREGIKWLLSLKNGS